MPSGKFYSGVLTADTDVDTGAVATGKCRTVNINLVNASASNDATAKVYIGTSATPAAGDYVESNVLVPKNGGVFKLTGEPMGAGERVVLRVSGSSNVTARISGFEENA
ncbi:hypothetical protein Nit79A3_1478 [Nitrosomonas sp. Is79A3]|uniref:hypothetical protein n=1 Tax=Nitrosomonas sp. (strain Is79A3) TaxID=261292 RepID=UPI000215D1AD